MRKYLILPLLAAAAACATNPPPPRGGFARAGRGVPRAANTFISPMGEPFRGQPGDNPIGIWFAGADMDHDGALTLKEIQDDASRFFAALDVNRDGEIDPVEVERYETQIAPEIHRSGRPGVAGPAHARGSARGGRGGGYRRGGPRPFYGDRPALRNNFGGGRAISLLDLPEPVTAADADFNRGVTLEEFRQAAAQRFLLLDGDRDGKLGLKELSPLRARSPGADRAPLGPMEN